MTASLPKNVHVSQHPCARAKLSQLRSQYTNSKNTKTLIHEIATIVGVDALGHGLQTRQGPTVSASFTISLTVADPFVGDVWLMYVLLLV